MNDSKIILLLWNRAEDAISALEAAYGRLLHRIAYNILAVPQDAQECVNDTYFAIWNTIPPERPDPLCPFVCRLCRNIALNRLRSLRAEKRCGAYDLSLEELTEAIPGKSLEETVSARELGRAINAFLGTQTESNRNLFLRRYWFGDSVQETAKCLGITPNAASVRLNRMRSDLKTYLIREELYYEG